MAIGEYLENITLKTGVGYYGGFNGTETAREQRHAWQNRSVLDGQYKGTVVTIPSDATSATVLDGFTIRYG